MSQHDEDSETLSDQCPDCGLPSFACECEDEQDRSCGVCGGSGGGTEPELRCRACAGTGLEKIFRDWD